MVGCWTRVRIVRTFRSFPHDASREVRVPGTGVLFKVTGEQIETSRNIPLVAAGKGDVIQQNMWFPND